VPDTRYGLDGRLHRLVIGTIDGVVQNGGIAVGDGDRPAVWITETPQAPADVEGELGITARQET
jgi:hypothetical protein